MPVAVASGRLLPNHTDAVRGAYGKQVSKDAVTYLKMACVGADAERQRQCADHSESGFFEGRRAPKRNLSAVTCSPCLVDPRVILVATCPESAPAELLFSRLVSMQRGALALRGSFLVAARHRLFRCPETRRRSPGLSFTSTRGRANGRAGNRPLPHRSQPRQRSRAGFSGTPVIGLSRAIFTKYLPRWHLSVNSGIHGGRAGKTPPASVWRESDVTITICSLQRRARHRALPVKDGKPRRFPASARARRTSASLTTSASASVLERVISVARRRGLLETPFSTSRCHHRGGRKTACGRRAGTHRILLLIPAIDGKTSPSLVITGELLTGPSLTLG